MGRVDDRRGEVEHLEHALEADERGHDVDLHVGERGQRPVQPVEVRREGDEGADAERTEIAITPPRPYTRAVASEARRPRAVMNTREYIAEVTPMSRTRPARTAEVRRLASGIAEQLHEQGARHVEALGHHLAHLAVEAVALTRDLGESATDPPGGEHEQRQQHEGEQRDLPGQHEHRGERHDDRDDVADDVGERRGERLLSTLDVVVQARDEGAGLGADEESDRHPLDVIEDLCAQIVDQTLTDACRVPPLGEPEKADRRASAASTTASAMTSPVRPSAMPWSMIAR